MIKAFTFLISWLFNTAGINILLPIERQEFKGTITVNNKNYELSFIVNSFFGVFLDSEEIVVNDMLLEIVLDYLNLDTKILEGSQVNEYTWSTVDWRLDYLTSPAIIINLQEVVEG